MSGLRTFSGALTFVMLAIFASMVAIASGYPAGARFMPFVVGIPGIVLCLLQLALDWRRARVEPLRDGQPTAALRGTAAPDGAGTEAPDRTVVRREAVIWGYVVAFVAGLLALGFWVSVPVMIAAFLRFEGKASWQAALGAAIGAVALLYAVFGLALRIELHPGFLTPHLVRLLGL